MVAYAVCDGVVMTREQTPDINVQELCDVILKAAGSGFQHYMPQTKTAIIKSATDYLNDRIPRKSPTPDGWYPMVTAHKDGRYIRILCENGKEDIAHWSLGEWSTMYGNGEPVAWKPAAPQPPMQSRG